MEITLNREQLRQLIIKAVYDKYRTAFQESSEKPVGIDDIKWKDYGLENQRVFTFELLE